MRGRDVALAPKEFSLLHVLLENRGRVVTRQALLDKVWGYDFEGEHQTISVHIRWLREKIEIDPEQSAPHHHRAQPRLHVQGIACCGTTCWRWAPGPRRARF